MKDGIMTAIVTPFKNGNIDWDALEQHIARQIDAGISALIVSGTTGESPTLSKDEKKQLFRFAVEQADGRIAIIAGTGSNNTAASIATSEMAVAQNVDGLLIVVPYYNKPTQEGLYQHFASIADAVSPIPIFLYNVPGRTVADLLPETIARLAEKKNVTHVKEATGKMERITEILKLAPRLTVLSGDDKTFFNGLSYGMKGIISVASNIFPEPMVALYNSFINGDVEKATSINELLTPFYDVIFCETNPTPVKSAAAYLGWMEDEMRLPLLPISAKNKPRLIEVLEDIRAKL